MSTLGGKSDMVIDEKALETGTIKCGHCGKQTTFRLHDPYRFDTAYPYGTDEVSEYKTFSTYICSTCSQPTLVLTIGAYNEVDGGWLHVTTETLYPIPSTQLNNLPELVDRRYNAALKVRYVEPNAFAVMVGRTLEAVCNHEKAVGRTLAEKLENLANSGRIPQTLAEMARQLRVLRNLGGHDAEDEVTEADVPIILDFLEAILEYLYVAPAKIAAVQARLKTAL